MSSTTMRFPGKIKMMNPEKGFGFIRREEGPDLFFHISECVKREDFKSKMTSKDGGTPVSFSVGEGRKGEEAREVSCTE